VTINQATSYASKSLLTPLLNLTSKTQLSKTRDAFNAIAIRSFSMKHNDRYIEELNGSRCNRIHKGVCMGITGAIFSLGFSWGYCNNATSKAEGEPDPELDGLQ
jgi:hypothetical protein